MLAALSAIIDGIGAILNFIVSSFLGVMRVFVLISESFVFLNTAIFMLPSFLYVFVSAGIVLLIVFFIIGR